MGEGTGRLTVCREGTAPAAHGNSTNPGTGGTGEGQVEFRILGPVEVWLDGEQYTLDGSKQRTVLASLLLARGRILADEKLSSFLWGEEPPNTAAAQLYTHVSRLRKLLGARAAIRRHRPGYLIEIGTALSDHVEFERLSAAGRAALAAGSHQEASGTLGRALRLWRGPALANVTEHLAGMGLPGLEEARMVALESRIEADLALGHGNQLLAELTGLVTAYPLRERLRGQLMVALYRADRQADALGVYHDGRTLLAEELGVDLGPALTGLYQDILSGEPDVGPVAERSPLRVTPPEPVLSDRRPATLPSGVPDFTGREEPARQLADLLVPAHGGGSSGIAMITGMPGVGKSALAVHVSHRCRDAFPDGQLYADLREPNGAPADCYQVLGSFLRSLGMAESEVPQERAERIRCYRSLLADRRVLVVLDNAASDRQVRCLLPSGPGCGVLITSRSPLTTLEGTHLVDLEPMDGPDGVVMLAAIIGEVPVAAEAGAARALTAACGGLPLAIRVAGARLSSGSHHSPGRLLNRLRDESGRLDQLRLGSMDVRASLESAYWDLDPRARAGLRRLALLDVPDFASWVTAAVLEVSEEDAEDVMDALVGARLVTVLPVPGDAARVRYRLHDLVRLMARERAVGEEPVAGRRAAVDRAMGAWLALANEADRRLTADRPGGSGGGERPWLGDRPDGPGAGLAVRKAGPPGVSARSGGATRWRLGATHVRSLLADPLDWFDQERAALVAVLDQAVRTGRIAQAWETARSMTGYFGLRGRHDDWRYTYQRAWTVACSGGDLLGQTVILRGLAELSAVLGDEGARRGYENKAGLLLQVLERQGGTGEDGVQGAAAAGWS
ncbi:winged helix-turn-helix domain-containing protein [Kineosporia sp. J2-2]|uniref:Winged helix-turn-helix domain-containing protein n=1 Tax=Kineosporia corallincola TaxID=2835133 RepID=A0ABS5TGW1_9ACTN|nr:BTAD domain-containing putative transcriptional regulator [Kineosporia corallincola]MBT0770108.1 winged helix-turn-helix domain-containing protein [Kineosporia corallincola]